jgi:hypothetical protein
MFRHDGTYNLIFNVVGIKKMTYLNEENTLNFEKMSDTQKLHQAFDDLELPTDSLTIDPLKTLDISSSGNSDRFLYDSYSLEELVIALNIFYGNENKDETLTIEKRVRNAALTTPYPKAMTPSWCLISTAYYHLCTKEYLQITSS